MKLPALGTEVIVLHARNAFVSPFSTFFIAAIDSNKGITLKLVEDTNIEICWNSDEAPNWSCTGTFNAHFKYVVACIHQGVLDLGKWRVKFPYKKGVLSSNCIDSTCYTGGK